MKLFKHQQQSINFFNENPIAFDMSDAGTGKTGAHIVWFAKRRTRKAMLVIAPKSLLVSAWANDIKKFAPMLQVVVATAANRAKAFASKFEVLITNHDAVSTLAKQNDKWFKQFDTIVIDECFPAGTPVDTPSGPIPIQMLKIGDLINTSSGPLPISNTFSHYSDKLLHIELESGESIECTENHPFATTNGWVEARSLRNMSVVRLDVHQQHEQWSEVLQQVMQQEGNVGFENTRSPQRNIKQECREAQRSSELEQRYSVPTRDQSKAERPLESKRTQTANSRWQWTSRALRINDARDAFKKLVLPMVNHYWEKTKRWIPAQLQSRLRASKENESIGNRRKFAHIAKTLGCEERFITGVTRVVSVTHLEQPSKRMVFNLQVNGPHTYSVKATLVHNCTAFKHHASGRSKALAKISKHFKYRHNLTATPTSNGIKDLWHQVFVLDGGTRLGKSFFGFRNACCEPQQTGPMPNMVKWADKPGIEEKINLMISDIVIRHKFEECVDIPPNHEYTLEYTLPAKHMAMYNELVDTSMLLLKDTSISAINGAVLYTKLLQSASGAAYDDFGGYSLLDTGRYELVSDLVDERDHSIVFFNWGHQRDELCKLAEKRGFSYAVIDGSVPSHEREAIVDHYQKGFYKVLFAHPQSAGHGLTLTRGRTTIWASPTVNLEHFVQANRRIYRISQKNKTETIVIIAPGTVDERVYEALQRKNTNMMNLLGELQCSHA